MKTLTQQQKFILVAMYGKGCFDSKKPAHPTKDSIKKWLPKEHRGHLRKALRKLRYLELVEFKKVGRAGDSYFLTELGRDLVRGWCSCTNLLNSKKLQKKLEFIKGKEKF